MRVVLKAVTESKKLKRVDPIQLHQERYRRRQTCGTAREQEIDIVLAMTSPERL